MRSILFYLDKASLSRTATVCKTFTDPAQLAHARQECAKKRFAFRWVHTSTLHMEEGWFYKWFADFSDNNWIIKEKGVLTHNDSFSVYFVKNAKPRHMSKMELSDASEVAVVLANNSHTLVLNTCGPSYSINWKSRESKMIAAEIDGRFNETAVVEYKKNIISFIGRSVVQYDACDDVWYDKDFKIPVEFQYIRSGCLYACKNSHGVFLFHFDKHEVTGTRNIKLGLDHVIMFSNKDPLGFDEFSDDVIDSDDEENSHDTRRVQNTDKMTTIHTTGTRPSYVGPGAYNLCSVHCVQDNFVFLSNYTPTLVATAYVFTPTLIHGVWHGLFEKLPAPAPIFETPVSDPNGFLFHVTTDAVSYNLRSRGRWELRVEETVVNA